MNVVHLLLKTPPRNLKKKTSSSSSRKRTCVSEANTVSEVAVV